MKFIYQIASVLCLLTYASPAFTQAEEGKRLFQPEELLVLVQRNHPVAKQAQLLVSEAEAQRMAARGMFDPKAFGQYDRKYFEQKNYYSLLQAGFKIPTWFGAELKAQYDWNSGVNVNPEAFTPNQGLATAGIKLPLLQGLFIDQRRAALQQSKIMLEASVVERKAVLNNLFRDAIQAYYDWAMYFEALAAYEQSLNLSRLRYEGVLEAFQQGDRPATDTLEALLIVQDRQFMYNNALMEFQNAGLYLSTFLWAAEEVPLELGDDFIPQNLASMRQAPPARDSVVALIDGLDNENPELALYAYKLESLEIDRKMKLEQLKPQLDVEYNFLARGANYIQDPYGEVPLWNSYKFGVTFSMPLFLRKERAGLKLADIKIENTRQQFVQKRLEVENKLLQFYNKLENDFAQINLYQSAVSNYRALNEAEQLRFQLGESSIFMLNAREQKLLEASIKLIELDSKFQQSLINLAWLSGTVEL
jgi:outer membrane protein TolC